MIDQIILSVFICALIFLAIFNGKFKKHHEYLPKILKISAVVLFALYVLRVMLSDSFVFVINGGKYGDTYYKSLDVISSLIRWSFLVSVCTIPTAAFFKNRTLNRLSFYVSIVNVILTVIFYNRYMHYFLVPVSPDNVRGIPTAAWIRHIEFDLEIISLAISSYSIFIINKKELLLRNKKEVFNFIIYLPILFLICTPVYLTQSLFGFTNVYMELLKPQHIFWLLATVMLLAYIYFIFRDKDQTIKDIIVCFLCLFLFQHYNSIYSMNFNAGRLPFQLCNVGSYFLLIAFILRKRPETQAFFDFIFIVNLFGTLFATVGFDLDDGLLSFWNIHYYLEHTWIFIIPYLMVAFHTFKMPSKKCFIHAVVGFTIYFLFCLMFGIVFNGYYYVEGHSFWNKVNYFYLFDPSMLDGISIFSYIKKVPVKIGNETFYPLLILTSYFGFIAGSIGFFYLNKAMYHVAKKHSAKYYSRKKAYQNK